jgi:hypothetical protein
MPLSWNTVNTHVAGDVLPLADWNQAATALNSMVGTWITTGVAGSNSTTNASPPFYCYFGYSTQTSNSNGTVQVNIPNGGFPNGTVMALAQPQSQTFPTNVYSMAFDTSPTKTYVQWQVNNSTTGNTIASTSVSFSFFIIGY